METGKCFLKCWLKGCVIMRVAIYMRVGNGNQTNEWAMKNQEERLRQFAKEQGHEIVAAFSEYGSTCYAEREMLKKVTALPSNEVDGILVTDVSRIHRNMPSFLSWLKELDASKKKLLTIDGITMPDNLYKQLQRVYEEIPKQRGHRSKKG